MNSQVSDVETGEHESPDRDQDSPFMPQDSSTVDQNTPPTQQDIVDTTQIIPHGRRLRRQSTLEVR